MPQVAVIGAGPVGLVCALALKQRGLEVVVYEAGDQLPTESRASTFHPPTLEFLDELGVAGRLLEIGLLAPTTQYRRRDGSVIAELDLSVLSGDTPFPFRVQCEQNKLCGIIAPEVEVRFGHRAVGVEPDGKVKFESQSPVTADFVVAADGAHSSARKSLGIDFEGTTYTDRYLVISTTTDVAALIDGIGLVNYISDPEQWMVLLRTPEVWRVLIPVDDQADVDPVSVLNTIHSTEWNIAETTAYRVHQRVASTFNTGRVLLAGDAAHINNPLGGLGMNSGIHDAIAAANRISEAATSQDPAARLAEYSDVRRRVAINHVQSATDGNYRRMRATDPETVAANERRLAQTASDPVLMREALIESTLLHVARQTV